MKNKGFTLIELILYMAIVSIVITVVGYFVSNMSVNISNIQDNEEDGTELIFVVERLTREIQNASDIDLSKSVFDSVSSKLALVSQSGDIETINLSPEGAIRKTYADGKYDIYTSDDVKITSLIFFNQSLPKRPGIIRIQIFSTNLNVPFEAAVSLRKQIFLK